MKGLRPDHDAEPISASARVAAPLHLRGAAGGNGRRFLTVQADEKLKAATAAAIASHGIDESLSRGRSEEHTSELQSLMRISYAVFCLKKKKHNNTETKRY